MRTKKKSSGKIPEKKSAVPYKSAAPHRHKPSRPLQTVKLPKSQSWKGNVVPRPTLTRVASNGQSDAYRRMD